ncbi:hypothetical protein [Streptomyces sp. VRA16 Mangrove soil]|uniref:hypothetical protein n=1 Tax=Streptomyces sp. VRA16 Mangrove soil TaxID=2817434 RepID=UPI001A9D84A3|nr:hypothetical protein [Streptomyces sp. VRA16 Mangrove soil]MBO1337873.1 hypothetical protein [Streptomyces sp. VRA16 Mangrove soil]
MDATMRHGDGGQWLISDATTEPDPHRDEDALRTLGHAVLTFAGLGLVTWVVGALTTVQTVERCAQLECAAYEAVKRHESLMHAVLYPGYAAGLGLLLAACLLPRTLRWRAARHWVALAALLPVVAAWGLMITMPG